MPSTFGSSTFGYSRFSIYCSYTTESSPPVTTVDLGDTDVYGITSATLNRRAMAVTFIEDGDIQSISIYHNGGTGNVLMGVYSDNSGSPGSLLGVTPSTPVNGSEGWQKVSLSSPVSVNSGETVWLAWVFSTYVKTRRTGASGFQYSSGTWSEGMPSTFGSSTFGYSRFSIYCTYVPDESKSAKISTDIEADMQLPELKVYPNPFSDKLRFEFVSPESVNARIDIYDLTGRIVKTIFEQPIESGVSYEAEFKPDDVISGMYIYRLTLGKNIYNGKAVYKKE
jgi:hypothetical protein